jgi:hypothetical protein
MIQRLSNRPQTGPPLNGPRQLGKIVQGQRLINNQSGDT